MSVTQLYTDCLYSIFWFLPLTDLASANAVCHSWCDATHHMPAHKDATHSYAPLAANACEIFTCSCAAKHMTSFELTFNECGLSIFEFLEHHKRLSCILLSISISSTHIVKQLANVIRSNKNITDIDFSYAPICANDCNFLTHILANQTHLIHVRMDNMELPSFAVQNMVTMLNMNPKMKTFDIHGTPIKNNIMIELTHAIQIHPGLTYVNLSTCERMHDPWDRNLLCQLVAHTKTITTLNWMHNHITAADAIALADALQSNKTLTCLIMSNNCIADDGATAIAHAIASHPSLTRIDLDDNHITHVGIVAIAKAVTANQRLQDVDVSSNRLVDTAWATSLADMLASSPNLTRLKCDNNEMTDVHAILFAQALAKNASLKTLSLESNDITTEGMRALAQTIGQHATLTNVDVSYNESSMSLIEFTNTIRLSRSLKMLDVGNVESNNSGLMDLCRAFLDSPTMTELKLSEHSITQECLNEIKHMYATTPCRVSKKISTNDCTNCLA